MRTRTLVVLAGGLLAVLALMATVFAPHVEAQPVSRASLQQAALAAPPGSVLYQTPPVSCTVSVTQTVLKQGNQSFDNALLMGNVGGLSLVAPVDVPPGTVVQVPTIPDYYYINVFAGNHINVTVSPASAGGNYNLGLEIFNNARILIGEDSDPSNFSASLSDYVATYSGVMYFRVYQLRAAGTCSGGTYNISFTNTPPTITPSITPHPTKTIGPTPTPYAGAPSADRFEPNNNFDQATTIGLNVVYDSLNFVQWDVNSTDWDNDFFKVRVKPGMLVTCRTLNLKPGTDTNLILYDASLNGINGSDDINRAAGDLSSSVSFYITYEGWLYGLVGEGFSRPVSEQAGTGYSFECTIGTQSTATPAPTSNIPTFTPVPTETPTPPPTLTPTPPFISVKPLPTATPPGLPKQQVPVSLLTYYDANGNNKYDPGEGIVGISARVIDLTTGELLAQGLTDTTGRVSFTVGAPGAVQLVVPYLNRSEIILPSGKAVTIRVNPSELPSAIP